MKTLLTSALVTSVTSWALLSCENKPDVTQPLEVAVSTVAPTSLDAKGDWQPLGVKIEYSSDQMSEADLNQFINVKMKPAMQIDGITYPVREDKIEIRASSNFDLGYIENNSLLLPVGCTEAQIKKYRKPFHRVVNPALMKWNQSLSGGLDPSLTEHQQKFIVVDQGKIIFEADTIILCNQVAMSIFSVPNYYASLRANRLVIYESEFRPGLNLRYNWRLKNDANPELQALWPELYGKKFEALQEIGSYLKIEAHNLELYGDSVIEIQDWHDSFLLNNDPMGKGLSLKVGSVSGTGQLKILSLGRDFYTKLNQVENKSNSLNENRGQ